MAPCNKESSGTVGSEVITTLLTTNMDPFLKTYLPLYENNVKLSESLLVALLQVFCQKVAGHQNPELSA